MTSPDISPPRRAALAFIFVTVVLDILALGIVIPVLPKLIEEFLKGDTARAAEIFGGFNTVWALMQFVCSPVLGALSDRYGRRLIVLISSFGLGLDYVLMAVAPSLPWLFVGRVISGITAASFAAASAYVADVTPPEKRAGAYGLVGAAWGLGFVLGPALGGVLGEYNPRFPFWAAAVMTLMNATYGLFVLPESHPPENREPFNWRKANPVGSLVLLRKHRELLGLAGVSFLYFLAHQVLPSVFVLYASQRYGWSIQTMGLSMGAIGICNIIVQGGLVKIVVGRFGERLALLAGLFSGAAGFIVYGLAPTGLSFALGVPVFAMIGFVSPASQGLMTRHVEPSEQGQLQGANSSLMGITGMIGPGLFSFTFAYFIDAHSGLYLPGAPFLLAAMLNILAFFLAWKVTRSR